MLLADGVEVGRALCCDCVPRRSTSPTRSCPPYFSSPLPVSAGAPPAMQFFDREHIGYWSANDIRLVRGGFGVVGPASAWLRLNCPVVAGEQVAPFERVAAAADFGSGIGNPLASCARRRSIPRSASICSAIPRASGSGWNRAVGRTRRRRPGRDDAVRPARAARMRPWRRCWSARSAAAGPDSPRRTPRPSLSRRVSRRSRTWTTSAARSSNSPLRNTSARGPARERRAAGRPGSGRLVRRSCAGPTAVSIVTRSDAAPLETRTRGNASDWYVENFGCLPARRRSDASTRSVTGATNPSGNFGLARPPPSRFRAAAHPRRRCAERGRAPRCSPGSPARASPRAACAGRHRAGARLRRRSPSRGHGIDRTRIADLG